VSRTVSLAADERGRVPFAVVGVLLLVSSLALATALRSDPAPSGTAVERTMDGMTAMSQTAVRDSVATAASRAAADPVVDPANTTVGRALNDSRPFRSALRLRVYLQVRRQLGRLSTTREGVTATASLPAANTTSGYESAIDRVSIERAGANNTSMRATVENITVTARRGGEVVTRRNVSHTVVVPTSVLYVHERVESYETRLNNSLASPGLSRRMTARLYPMAWARGYAQYGGAPIENVVANRHVSLATNGALLGVQRSVFGRSDSEGRQALTEATATVGIEDIVTTQTNGALASHVLSAANYGPASQNISTGGDVDVPQANESMRVGINGTADAAFRDVASSWELNTTAREAYTVDVQVVTERERLSGGRPDRPDSPPGQNWTFRREETTTTTTIVSNLSERPPVPSGWHTIDGFGRVVEVEYERVTHWHDVTNGERQATTANSSARFLVRGVLAGDHSNESVAPVRGISTAYDSSGSPLNGQNLADVESAAAAQLLDNESYDSVARSVAIGSFTDGTTSVIGERPDSMYTWLYEDLRDLRETVREITTTVERGAVGTFETDPAEQLDQRLAERRARLLSVPGTYNSTAERARVAARIDYLDAVSERLTAQSENHSAIESNLSSQLGELSGGSLTELRRGLTAQTVGTPGTAAAPVGPAGPVQLQINAQPQYLTLASVEESQAPAVNGSEHPLVARNVNVFSVPYGDAASAALTTMEGNSNRVMLGTAAETLRAANETNLTTANETLEENRGELQDAVADANTHVETALTDRVETQTAANTTVAEDIVTTALRRWSTTAGRGRAIANTSAADAVASVAADRENLSAVAADWLRIQLGRTTIRELGAGGSRPETSVVNRTANTVQEVARSEIQSAIENEATGQVEDVAQRRLGQRVLPAGLPLAPPLTAWYATMNVWWVTIEGEYARFSVSAEHGTTAVGSTQTTYAREDETVTLDVDGDEANERLGENERVSFDIDTGVVVVVPPQPRGVGDKDGTAVETSAGWPDPG